MFAMIPFIVADVGNILGGLFTQWLIRGGLAIPKARKLAVSVFGLTMAAVLPSGPLVIGGPPSALAVLSVAGFGWAAYSASSWPSPRMFSRSALWPRCGGSQASAPVSAAHASSTRPVSPSPTCARRSALLARTTPFSSPMVWRALVGLTIVLFPMGLLTRDETLQ